jgi:hypothetical protein
MASSIEAMGLSIRTEVHPSLPATHEAKKTECVVVQQ